MREQRARWQRVDSGWKQVTSTTTMQNDVVRCTKRYGNA